MKVYVKENSSVKKMVLKVSIEFTKDKRTKFILILIY